jgi:hypothetical protein
MAIHRYFDIGEAVRFAVSHKATSLLVETDSGNVDFTPEEALAEFEDLAPGEAFSILNISFAGDTN